MKTGFYFEMKIENGKNTFGFWTGMPYGKTTDKYEDFEQINENIKQIAQGKLLFKLVTKFSLTLSLKPSLINIALANDIFLLLI